MHTIDARALDFQALNQQLREGGDACAIINCCGQRFIAAGMAGKSITIDGVPGNALGAYLNGASVTVRGNAQDAVGDTMNEGEIIVHGGIGDAAGYAMRGGRIPYPGRRGIPCGNPYEGVQGQGSADGHRRDGGQLLGEYQAGGVIVVLGLNAGDRPIVGNFPCTGMHGGKLFLRGRCENIRFPGQLPVSRRQTATRLRRSNGT